MPSRRADESASITLLHQSWFAFAQFTPCTQLALTRCRAVQGC